MKEFYIVYWEDGETKPLHSSTVNYKTDVDMRIAWDKLMKTGILIDSGNMNREIKPSMAKMVGVYESWRSMIVPVPEGQET